MTGACRFVQSKGKCRGFDRHPVHQEVPEDAEGGTAIRNRTDPSDDGHRFSLHPALAHLELHQNGGLAEASF